MITVIPSVAEGSLEIPPLRLKPSVGMTWLRLKNEKTPESAKGTMGALLFI
jgi:hypothetical protein